LTKKKAGQSVAAAPPAPSRRSYWIWVAVGLVVLAAAIVRLRLADLPLERDEGEYAYAGQLLLEGVPPYSLAFNMKFPGIYAAYAVILALFGQTAGGIHIGLTLVCAATTVLVFLLARRLMDSTAGFVAAATYALLALSPMMLALAGHATHFVVLAAVGGLLLLLRGIESGRRLTFLWSGLCLGVAILMKQPGAVFVVLAGLYLVWTELWSSPRQWKRLGVRVGLVAAGTLAPLVLTGLALWWAGVFGRFWFWTFVYASQYGTIMTLSQGMQNLEEGITVIGPTWGLWVLAGIGLVAPLWDRKLRPYAFLLAGLAVLSFVGTSAGLYYRNHYFILMFPAVAVLAGAAVSSVRRRLAAAGQPMAVTMVPMGVFAAVFAYAVVQQHVELLDETPGELIRSLYAQNPFPESIQIGDYIRKHTSPEDRIAVIGSEPQIYFYAHRRSATGYIYIYGLMEQQPYAHQMQTEMIEQIEAARPKYIVMVSPMLRTSWLWYPTSDKTVFQWVDDWCRRNYHVVGFTYFVPLIERPRGWQDWKLEARWDQEATLQVQQWDSLLAEQVRQQAGAAAPPGQPWVVWKLPMVAVLESNGTTP
jgi:hypothetical protein